MTINGKPKTPIITAQSKKDNSHEPEKTGGKAGGTKARASRTAKNKTNGVKTAVLERINDGLLAFDAGLNYTYLNERAGELLGCKAADLVGRSLWEAHPDAKGSPFAEACRRALETQTIVPLDGYFPATDRWLEGRVYPSQDGVSVLFTESGPQNVEENRRREGRYRILFDTMQEGFLLAEVASGDPDGRQDARILEVNASMARFLGKSREELIQHTFSEVFNLDEEDRDILQRACHVGLGEEEPSFVEKQDPFTSRWLRGHIFSPRRGQFACLLSDITEQKQAEARIQDISKFPGENPNPVLRFTPDGTILYANQASGPLQRAWEKGEEGTTPLSEIQAQLPSILEHRENREIEVASNGTFYMGLLVPVHEQGYINLYLRDITERKRVEESLRAHIHQTNAGITRTDMQGCFTFVNQAFCNLLGYSEQELIGKSIWEISHPDDHAKNKQMFERLLREGEPFQLEKRLLRRNGSVLWVNVGSAPLRDAGGRIQAATSIIVDITRRKRAEESLLDSARRTLYLSSLSDTIRSLTQPSKMQIETARLLGGQLKASRVAYIEVEPDGSTFVRDNYVDGVRDIVGRFDLNACIPASLVSEFQLGRTISASDVQEDSRFSISQKAALEAVSVRAQVIVPFTRDGEVLAALCIHQLQPRLWKNEEISLIEDTGDRLQAAIERAHAERRLRQSEERFRALVSQATAGIAQSDLDSRLTFINPRFCEMLGYPEEELLGKTIWELTYTEDLEENKRLFQRMLGQGKSYQFEKRFIRRDGSLVWANVSVTGIHDLAGHPMGGVWVVIDISKRKQAEQALSEFARQQEALYHLANRLNRTESLEDVFDPALDAILKALQCDRASILLYDETEVMHFVAWRGLSDDYRQATEGHSPWTPDAKDPQPIAMSDIRTADLEESLKAIVQKEGIGALAFIPLVSNEKLIGKFMVYFDKPHVFEEEELDFSLTIARQLASTIERKWAETALRLSEHKFSRLFHYAPYAVALQKLSEARFTEVNGEFIRLFGYSQEELTGRTSIEVGLLMDPVAQEYALQEYKNQGFVRNAEIQVRTKFGTFIWVSVNVDVVEIDGEKYILSLSTDITERKLAEEALQQSEERFVRFMQHLPGLAWIKDVQGRYVYVNAAAEKAFNIPREQLYGSMDEDIFPAETAAQFGRNDELALADEKGVQVIETLMHEDGILHSSLVSKFPIPGPDGSPALIGGTAFDITERIQMEEALQVARETAEENASRMARLQKVTAALSKTLSPLEVAQVVVDQGAPALGAASGSMLLLNESDQTLEVLYSAAPASLIRPYSKFPISLNVPAADAVRSGQPVWIESKQQYLVDYPHLAAEIERWGHQAGMAIPLMYKGHTVGVLTMSFDRDLVHGPEDRDFALTLAQQGAQALERARAEEALRESEERYRAIISQATAGIVRKDPGGRLIFVNHAFCNLLGYTASELMEKTMWELTHEEDVAENKRLYERLMTEGIPFQLEKRLIRRDGSILWVNVSVSPVVDASGKPKSAVSVYADVTRRRQAENRLVLLAMTSELTRQFEEPDELLFAVSKAVGEYFQVRRSLFNEIDLENDREVVHRDYTRGVESVAGVHKVSEYSSVTTAEMMAGKTVVNYDSKLDPRTAPDYERTYVRTGERAYVAVPLMHEDRWVASLWISDDTPRDWDKEDVYLLEAIAERAWTAAEKLRIDRALRDSEEQLRVTFNTTAVGFAMLKPDTSYVDVNDAYCRIVGYSRAELLGMNSYMLNHPDFVHSTREHVAQLLAGKVSSFTIEKLYVRGDGREIWVQNSVSLVRDVDGEPLHLIVICQDITERKREEEALRARTEEIEALMEVSPIAIYIAQDPECHRISGNPAAYNLIELPVDSHGNLSRSAPEGERPVHRVFRDGVELAVPDLPIQAAARLGKEIEEETLELRFENGTRKYIYAYAKPLFDRHGNSRGAIAAMLDITERRRAEEALHQLNLQLEERVQSRTTELQSAYEFLRESEATSRLILESMPDAIVITDHKGQIVHANTQVEALFGYTPSEVLGQPVEILIPERFRGEHLNHRDSYASQRSRRIMGLGHDLFGQRKDGSEFPIEVMLSPINNNTTWDVMVSIRDNTKQREAQEALRTNEEKLRTLFEILPVGISFLDKDGRISDMNPALTEILGLTKNDLLNGVHRARRYIRSDGSPMPQSEFASRRAIQEQKTIYNVETGIVQENGEIRWTSVNAAPVQVADVEAVVVTIDITERKQSEEVLHKHRERLRVLSRRLVEVQEEERRAIARELHDRVGQNLAALTLNLNILRNQLTSEVLEKVGTRLKDSVSLLNDILGITRSVMADLRPNVLDDYGLDAAINEYTDRFMQRFGIRVTTNTSLDSSVRFDPSIEMTLLRIAQEALTNIARHSKASQAVMSLEVENDIVMMTIEDNGIGILSWQKVNQPGSHGLQIMRERAEAFGGFLKVHSTYKNGTRIEVGIPLGSSGTRNKDLQEKRS